MTIRRRQKRSHGSSRHRDALKDRLIQTRVPGGLESALKDEARKRRLSVSHLIRNVLEDTFHLVDNVVAEVDNIVHDSVGLARQVTRDAGRIAGTAQRHGRRDERDSEPAPESEPAPSGEPEEKPEDDALAHVLAWNKVVMNAAGSCTKCHKALTKGDEAHLGLSSVAGTPPTFLCGTCITRLGS